MIAPWSAVVVSLKIGLWCAALGLLPAIGLGWILARGRFVGKSLLSTLTMAPLTLPPVVTGFLLLRLTGQSGFVGKLLEPMGVSLPFSLAGAVLAALIVGMPLYVMAARAAFESVDPRLEDVSKTMGQPPFKTFWRVTLPLALPGLGAGAVLAFARALGEFGATIVMAGNMEGQTRSIALAVYTLLEAPGGENEISTLLWVSVALSFAALLGCEWLWRRQRVRVEMSP